MALKPSKESSAEMEGQGEKEREIGEEGNGTRFSFGEDASCSGYQKIFNFCVVTGTSEDVARHALESCNYDLEQAIKMHLDNPDFSHVSDRHVVEMISNPLRSLHPGLECDPTTDSMNLDGFTRSSASEVAIKRLYALPVDIMFQGDVQNACRAAISKWLLINMHNPLNFKSQVFNRDVLSEPTIKEIVSENFVFVQLYNDSLEGQRYMQSYEVSNYPYVAVMHPRTGKVVAQWSPDESITFASIMFDFIERNPWHQDPDSDQAGAPSASSVETKHTDEQVVNSVQEIEASFRS